MSTHTDDTLIHDVAEAVNAVLNNPAMSKTVRGTGETAPLSGRDEDALFDFVSALPFMARFKEKYFESEPDFDRTNLLPTNERHLARLCNICLVIAIACRVANGIYPGTLGTAIGNEYVWKEAGDVFLRSKGHFLISVISPEIDVSQRFSRARLLTLVTAAVLSISNGLGIFWQSFDSVRSPARSTLNPRRSGPMRPLRTYGFRCASSLGRASRTAICWCVSRQALQRFSGAKLNVPISNRW